MSTPKERQALHFSPLAQMLFCIARLVQAAQLDFAILRLDPDYGYSARQTALKNRSCFSPGSRTQVVQLLNDKTRLDTKALM